MTNPDQSSTSATNQPGNYSGANAILATAIAALGTDYRKADVCATVAIAIELHRLADLFQHYYDEETGLG